MQKYKNEYEKYKYWFEQIERMCKDETLVENKHKEQVKHYFLGNGINAYVGESEIVLKHSENEEERIIFEILKNSDNEYSLIIIDKENHENKGRIIYQPNGKNHYCLTVDVEGDMSQDKNKILGELPNDDMSAILMNAKVQSKNQQTREIYERAIDFHQSILNAIRTYTKKTQKSIETTTDSSKEEMFINLSNKRLKILLDILEEENRKKQEIIEKLNNMC